jgi:hypothetical protein
MFQAEYWSEHHIVLGAVKADRCTRNNTDRFEIDHLPPFLVFVKKGLPYPRMIGDLLLRLQSNGRSGGLARTRFLLLRQASGIYPRRHSCYRLEIKLDATGLSTSMVMAACSLVGWFVVDSPVGAARVQSSYQEGLLDTRAA